MVRGLLFVLLILWFGFIWLLFMNVSGWPICWLVWCLLSDLLVASDLLCKIVCCLLVCWLLLFSFRCGVCFLWLILFEFCDLFCFLLHDCADYVLEISWCLILIIVLFWLVVVVDSFTCIYFVWFGLLFSAILVISCLLVWLGLPIMGSVLVWCFVDWLFVWCLLIV